MREVLQQKALLIYSHHRFFQYSLMNTNCTTTSCQPAITIACIISCALCTIIMIWGVFAMRQDISQMATGHTSMNMSDPMSMSMRDMGSMLEGKS
jgi:hypothetical protein